MRIENGYSACLGMDDTGWYAGILIIDDIDGPFVHQTPRSYTQAFHDCRHWQEAFAKVGRRVILAREDGSDMEISLAARVCGPACPKENTHSPILAWTQRKGDAWELISHANGVTRTVATSRRAIRRPQVALIADGPIFACERDSGIASGEIVCYDQWGKEVLRVPGRSPRMVACDRGIALLSEQASRNNIKLRLQRYIDGRETGSVILSGKDEYTFNGDLAWNPSGERILIVAETCPAFGMDDRIGLHRDLKAWSWSGHRPEDMSGKEGRLPIQRRAFNYWSTENMPPIRPAIMVRDGMPVVSFRQFRHYAFKTFGWDVFTLQFRNGTWGRPARVTENTVSPDTGYGIIPTREGYVGAFPCLDNPGDSASCSHFRVEIVEWRAGRKLPTVPVPPDRQDEYFVTSGVRNISIDPPPLDRPYEGRVLIWGDLHPHNAYSKCVSAMDGLPDEMLRYQRDVLGCRVLTLTDHCDKLGGPEATWLADSLESFAGENNIPLFGTETGQRPGRHTNWYAPDREAFDRLRCILISQDGDRLRTYRHVMEEMPRGSVVALRHFHGRIASDDELVHSFEGKLEVAMEAMQGRINALLESDERFPRYPNIFLDAGFKVGLVGGTDHFRAKGPNRFCLTGFWVKEASVDGVWEALRNRHTIAMSNARIGLAARMDGQPAGSTVSIDAASAIRVQVSASCGRNITGATLIRDGEVLPWVPIDARSATLELVDPSPPPGRHWYVPTVQVRTAYGKATPGYGHTSPFFVHVRRE